MRTQEIRFDGKTYVCRIVKSNEGEDLLIGSTKLLDALHPGSFEDENEGFAGKEAERLYDGIFFFTDSNTLALPNGSTEINNHLKAKAMNEEYVMQTAQTIRQQLWSMTPFSILMSWGITQLVATTFRNLPALRMKVNGRLHSGYVIIALNGSDYYEVYLLKQKDGEAECVHNEVCFDELGDVIDCAIESGTDKEEYDRFCSRQIAVLVKAQSV